MEHAKQHWVPQSYLASWLDPETPKDQEPYVWVFPRTGGDGRRKAPHNIFYETDMYTIRGRDGIRDLRLEHGLSELESGFAALRREKLQTHAALDPDDQLLLAAFVAAMHARSRRQRDHQRTQWGAVKETMDKMHAQMIRMTPEERSRIARMSAPRSLTPSMGREDVAQLATEPLQRTVPLAIETQSSVFLEMDLAILSTDVHLGFITSDAPCVIFDPEARTRPFPFNVTGLMYPKVEVTLPLSPNQLLAYSRRGLKGYIPTTPQIVDALNRMRAAYADDVVVCHRNETRASWFASEVGRDPPHAPN